MLISSRSRIRVQARPLFIHNWYYEGSKYKYLVDGEGQ